MLIGISKLYYTLTMEDNYMEKPILELIQKFTFTRSEVTVTQNMSKPHFHDSYELFLMLDGKRYIFINDMKLLLQKGDLFIIPPFVPHKMVSHNTIYYDRYAVNFSTNDLQPLFSDKEIDSVLINLSAGLIHLNELQLNTICNYLQMIGDYHIRYTEIARKMEFMTLFILLDYINILAKHYLSLLNPDSNSVQDNSAVINAIDYIKYNYTNEITLDTISKYVNLSKSQFCYLFKQTTGITFIKYLNNFRISKAFLLISRTKQPLYKIAEETGFYSTEHMARTFQSLYTLSPTQWRKKYIKDSPQL